MRGQFDRHRQFSWTVISCILRKEHANREQCASSAKDHVGSWAEQAALVFLNAHRQAHNKIPFQKTQNSSYWHAQGEEPFSLTGFSKRCCSAKLRNSNIHQKDLETASELLFITMLIHKCPQIQILKNATDWTTSLHNKAWLYSNVARAAEMALH